MANTGAGSWWCVPSAGSPTIGPSTLSSDGPNYFLFQGCTHTRKGGSIMCKKIFESITETQEWLALLWQKDRSCLAIRHPPTEVIITQFSRSVPLAKPDILCQKLNGRELDSPQGSHSIYHKRDRQHCTALHLDYFIKFVSATLILETLWERMLLWHTSCYWKKTAEADINSEFRMPQVTVIPYFSMLLEFVLYFQNCKNGKSCSGVPAVVI